MEDNLYFFWQIGRRPQIYGNRVSFGPNPGFKLWIWAWTKLNKILESLANPKISLGFEVVFCFEKIEVVFHFEKIDVVFNF